MAYAKIYPNLQSKYNFNNFEVIMQAFANHFSYLFNLNVLEHELASRQFNGSYVQLFHKCMQGLQDLYTEAEVVQQLLCLMQCCPIKSILDRQLIFVPPNSSSQPAEQLGFLEKIITGQ